MPRSVFVPSAGAPTRALPHVRYELEKLRRLQTIKDPGRENSHERDLWVEGILLHARSLHEFFKEHGEKDDIRAQDFGFKSSSGRLDPSVLVRIHKSLAHLSYGRLDYDGPNGNWTFDWLAPLLAVLYDFIHHVLQGQTPFPNDEERQRWQRLFADVRDWKGGIVLKQINVAGVTNSTGMR